jgi:hypothetical protein
MNLARRKWADHEICTSAISTSGRRCCRPPGCIAHRTRKAIQRGRCVSSLDKLNKEINAGLAEPKLEARFAELGSPVLPGSPTDFGKLIADETERWAKVVKFAGIEVE